MMMSRTVAVGAALLIVISVAGCAPVLFGGATSGAVALSNNRTVGAYIEDEAIENKSKIQLIEEIGADARYDIISINRIALVVGQAPSQTVKDNIIKIVTSQENLRKILDYVTVEDKISLARQAKDTLITARVKSALFQIQENDFSSLDVKVITEDSVVYMMGLVKRTNAALAVDAARDISGVKQVIKAFEYI